MLEEMINRFSSKNDLILNIELAEKTIEEGNKNLEYFKLLAKKCNINYTLIPYGKKLEDVINNSMDYIKFHEELKFRLEDKYFFTSH